MTVEEYASINKKNHTSTLFQLKEKDYMYSYSKEEYWIGEYDDHTCERGIAQFVSCATPGTEERNNCLKEVVSCESHRFGSPTGGKASHEVRWPQGVIYKVSSKGMPS